MTIINSNKIKTITLGLFGIAIVALSSITNANDDFAYFSNHFITAEKAYAKPYSIAVYANAEYASL